MKIILNHEKTNLTLHFYLIKVFKLQANWVTSQSIPSCRAIQKSPHDFPWKNSRQIFTKVQRSLYLK